MIKKIKVILVLVLLPLLLFSSDDIKVKYLEALKTIKSLQLHIDELNNLLVESAKEVTEANQTVEAEKYKRLELLKDMREMQKEIIALKEKIVEKNEDIITQINTNSQCLDKIDELVIVIEKERGRDRFNLGLGLGGGYFNNFFGNIFITGRIKIVDKLFINIDLGMGYLNNLSLFGNVNIKYYLF